MHVTKTNDLNQLWESAIELESAWFQNSPEYSKERFRVASEAETHGRTFEMRLNLQIDLAHGIHEAVGFPVGASSKTGPIKIGRQYFQKGSKIDWEHSRLSFLGKKFELVRIIFRNENSEDESIFDNQVAPITELKIKAKSKIGRPSTAFLLDDIIRKLSEEQDFIKSSQKARYIRIRESAKKQYPSKFVGENSPDKKTINQRFKLIFPDY